MSELAAAAAVVLFALLHSALASLQVKQWAARRIGHAAVQVWYRPFFLIQALVMTALLVVAGARLPATMAWHVTGGWAWVMRAVQAGALLVMVDTARRVGFARVSGWDRVRARVRRAPVAADPPAALDPGAQGPALLGGVLLASGLFRVSRHPLNLLPIPILWAFPTMPSTWLAAIAVATLYFVVGSWHEEYRLLRLYGEPYRRYRRDGPPLLVPWRGPRGPEVSGAAAGTASAAAAPPP